MNALINKELSVLNICKRYFIVKEHQELRIIACQKKKNNFKNVYLHIELNALEIAQMLIHCKVHLHLRQFTMN